MEQKPQQQQQQQHHQQQQQLEVKVGNSAKLSEDQSEHEIMIFQPTLHTSC